MSVVAVVTIARGRHQHLRAQHRSLARGSRRPDLYVVVAMDDPEIVSTSIDGLDQQAVLHEVDLELGLPLAAARNHGFAVALDAGADVVIGLDVDVLAGTTLVSGYADAVTAHPDRLWSGPVTYLPAPVGAEYDLTSLRRLDNPHSARPAPVPGQLLVVDDPGLFWSLSFATSAVTWSGLGGFHEAYVGYGAEDTDFGRVAAQAGVPMAWTGTARGYHQHHEVSDPPVEHVASIVRNANLFRSRWHSWPMLGWLEEFTRLGLVELTDEGWVETPVPSS